jgi:hypothetical protein
LLSLLSLLIWSGWQLFVDPQREFSLIEATEAHLNEADLSLDRSQSDDAAVPTPILSVSSGQSFIELENQKTSALNGDLSPSSDDFLITIWFKPSRLPSVGERFQLVDCFSASAASSKSEESTGGGADSRLGYALALSAERDGIRPMLYWADDESASFANQGMEVGDTRAKSRWYSFSQMPIHAHEWFQLVVLWHSKDNVLELRGFSPSAKNGELEVGNAEIAGESRTPIGHKQDRQFKGAWYRGGAYQLAAQQLSSNLASLKVGAVGDKRFRGLIGSVRIVRGAINPTVEQKVLNQISHTPNSKINFKISSDKSRVVEDGELAALVAELIPLNTNKELSGFSVYGQGKRFQFLNAAQVKRKISVNGGKSRGAAIKARTAKHANELAIPSAKDQ